MGQESVRTILAKFRKALETTNIRVDQLILYGSHAIGTSREGSDIDVVVISENFEGKDYWERIDILTEAIYQIFAPIDASAFTPEEWKAGTSLMADYARDGVLVN